MTLLFNFFYLPRRTVNFVQKFKHNLSVSLYGEQKTKEYELTYERVYSAVRKAIYKRLKKEFPNLPDFWLWKATKQGAKLITSQVILFKGEERKLAVKRLFPMAYKDSKRWLESQIQVYYKREKQGD